uniref:Myb/SANT-like DNA-binding domain-containing protein n=1 Tax=Paramormyrops kingsleyae TaxID=1676925 RepID=A0A3B3QC92_9TELE
MAVLYPNVSMERKPRFTAAELSVLVDEVERNRAILFSRLKNVTINADKKRAWEDITDKINSVGHGWRCTAVDVRGKWRDYASVTKRKAAGLRREQERTGGGSTSLPPLIPGEERVLAILGPEALEGVPGGIDVCGLRTSQTSMLSTPRSPPPGPATSDPLQCSPQAYSMPGPSTSAMPLPGVTPLLHSLWFLCRRFFLRPPRFLLCPLWFLLHPQIPAPVAAPEFPAPAPVIPAPAPTAPVVSIPEGVPDSSNPAPVPPVPVTKEVPDPLDPAPMPPAPIPKEVPDPPHSTPVPLSRRRSLISQTLLP